MLFNAYPKPTFSMNIFLIKCNPGNKLRVAFFLLGFPLVLFAQQVNYKVQSDGVIVYPQSEFAGGAKDVQLKVMGSHIIRVIASPLTEIEARNSLTVIAKPQTSGFNVNEANGKIVLTTGIVSASVNALSGAVSFTDATGKPLLAERSGSGRVIEPVMHDGHALYANKQIFETGADDAFYGLGQHQEDAMNYKGKQVMFYQNNTEVVVPFLITNKNYGILWDNYSYSLVGDTRPFQPLSILQLFDRKGNQGWLTASYSNDRNKPNDVALEKAESEIAISYVNDSKIQLPKDFNVDKGVVTYEGSIASMDEGVHKLKFTYAGYIKVWIDGKLVLEKWRQAWNPGVGLVEHNMVKGKKYVIKMEWIPDGGESYLTVNALSPIPVQDQNSFGFYSEAGRSIDYYFVYGNNMDEVISGYRKLTGKATMVPKWALGFWQSRERYKTQQELLTVVDEFRKRNIPLDNIVLDWSYWKENDWGSQEFDASRFSNPDSMIDVLHKKYNTQIMISVWPKFYEGVKAYKQFDAKGWLYKRNIADRQRDWIAQGYTSTFYDAFNEGARKGFWNLIHDKLYVKGIDAWWMDASEPDILSNVSPQRRKLQMTPTALGSAAEFMNAYPLQNAKGIYEGQRGIDNNKRVFLLTRSGFAGSQRYAATIWSGDIASRWEDMKAQISAGLNFSMSGLPYWTMDIGGFSVERRYEKPNEADLAEWRELQTRWYQFGTFVPLFRAHGQFPFREIYNIAPEDHPAYKSMLWYNQLRYRLMPYIYSLAGHAYHKDYTLMRGLVMDFSSDKNVLNIGDQYMFGPSLLINPVYTYKATSRNVYLPAGSGWYDFYTGKYEAGGREITADAPYERMPLFVREGSIIPTGPALQYTAEKPADVITLFIYAGKDATFTLYEDEDLNYNYEKGAFAEIIFNWDEAAKTLTIGNRSGSFTGMMDKRTFNIVVISNDKPSSMDFNAKPAKSVKYSGIKTVVKF
jgi:alpha-D-xyloside xylohydrolase